MSDALTPIIIDIITAALLVFIALRGRRRGLIKTLSGIIAVILAFSVAGYASKAVTPYISSKYVAPYLMSSIPIQTKEEISDKSPNEQSNELKNAFSEVGISKNIISDTLSEISSDISKNVNEIVVNMSNSISYKITYAVLFLIFFVLLLIIFSLLFKLLNIASRLPLINFLNKTLGLVLGVIFGYLIIVVLSFILLKFGFILSDEIINKTYVLKFILNFSPAVFLRNF